MQKEKRKNISRNWILAYLTAAFLAGGVVGFMLDMMFTVREPVVIMVTSQPIPTPTPIPYVYVVIALQTIPCGVQIRESAVDVIPWIVTILPTTTYGLADEVIGKYAMVDIPREMPILSGMLVDNPAQVPETCKSE